MSSKHSILKNVQHALNKNTITKAEAHYEQPYSNQQSDLIQQYKTLQEANRAKVYDVADLDSSLAEVFRDLDSQRILWTQNLPCQKIDDFDYLDYDKSVEELREELFDTDTSIIEAICGVANLGIVGLRSDVRSPRLASLITPRCVILLHKNNIVSSIYDGIQKLKDTQDKALPTNMIFVAGPSRTADIELQTVFGVHGPQAVSVVLFG